MNCHSKQTGLLSGLFHLHVGVKILDFGSGLGDRGHNAKFELFKISFSVIISYRQLESCPNLSPLGVQCKIPDKQASLSVSEGGCYTSSVMPYL